MIPQKMLSMKREVVQVTPGPPAARRESGLNSCWTFNISHHAFACPAPRRRTTPAIQAFSGELACQILVTRLLYNCRCSAPNPGPGGKS